MFTNFKKPMLVGFVCVLLCVCVVISVYSLQQVNRLTDDDIVDLSADKVIGKVWLGAGDKNLAIEDLNDQQVMKRQIYLRKQATEILAKEPHLSKEFEASIAQDAPYLVSIVWRETSSKSAEGPEKSLQFVVPNSAKCPAGNSSFNTDFSKLAALVCLPEVDLTKIIAAETRIQVTSSLIDIAQDQEMREYLISQKIEMLVRARVLKRFKDQNKVAQISQFVKSRYM
jgi:hypothetical protein